VNRRSQKTARNEEVVGEVDEDIDQGEEGGPALWNGEFALGKKLVSAQGERTAYKDDGDYVQASSGGERPKTCENEEVERDVEVALDGAGHRGGIRVDGGSVQHKPLFLAKTSGKGSVGSNRGAGQFEINVAQEVLAPHTQAQGEL